MKISLAWLSKFVSLEGITPEEFAHRLTMSGLEVSNIDNKGARLNHVVAGRLLKVVPHPNADKLSLTEVEIPGSVLKVVCGAKNIVKGDVVPVALEGAVLPNGMEIRRAKIRGEESMGMLCSERELGVADNHEGIMHLPMDTPLGTPVAKVLGWDDVVLEIEITPNRPDCLSHLGLARHASAVLDRPLTVPVPVLLENGPEARSCMRVAIEPGCGCRRYSGRIIKNVKIGPSPDWLRHRLEAVGLRSINNVVDVTNYILMEIGHPLHAFDLDRLEGGLIQARRAREGESLTTIDGVERKFSGAELVIADGVRPVALAGVMGGLATEVTDQTVALLLESAWFEPSAVRKTSRLTGCSSESSYRFERGTDPEVGLPLALDLAAQMIYELTGGQVFTGILDAYPERLSPRQIDLKLAKAEKILGMSLEPIQSMGALARLGFTAESVGENNYRVKVPPFRQDVLIEEDLIEEIAEMTGYDQIPLSVPMVPMALPERVMSRDFTEEVRRLSCGLGLTEIITYSFTDPSHFDRLRLPADHPWRHVLRLKNPISDETSVMRTSLLPGLVSTLSYNQRRGQERVFMFESGAVFLPSAANEELPREIKRLGLALTGPERPLHWQLGKKQPVTGFYDLKGRLDALFGRLHLPPVSFQPEELPFLHPKASFRVRTAAGAELGWAGVMHPEAQEAYKLKQPVMIAELDLDMLQTQWVSQPSVKGFSRFPSAARDIALAVPEETLAGEVIHAIRKIGGETLVSIVPFDWYQGEDLPAGTKSLAFSLTFQALDRTLTEEEVNALQAKIVSHLQKTFHARQR